ncbi:MAG: hypothetical protein NVSMB9_28690 [Isosphaeraceae bacterium]
MFPFILSIFLTALPGADGPSRDDARSLIATIEALQEPIEDFRCEFEGTIHFKGIEAERQKLGEDGLYNAFSGTFIWKRGGDTHSESLHRRAPDNGAIARQSLVVRAREHRAESYYRLNDASLGSAAVGKPEEFNSWSPDCLGFIFLIDKIKRQVADEGTEPSVHDDQVEGRPLKVLDIALKGIPDSFFFRYWIDLRRNGHVVSVQTYAPSRVMNSRLDIKLAPFKVGKAEVWMPVSGDYVAYEALVDNKPIQTKEPTQFETIYVVDGTLEFNKHPGPDVFTIKYKPGTPISDRLRQMTYEFGQQKIGLRPTKADAQKMLNEQVAQAEQQKSELVVASSSEGVDWWSWTVPGLGAITLISLIALWAQRRGR